MDLRFTGQEIAFRDEVRAFFRSEIPPDVQAYLKHRADRELDNIRKMMKAEGFHPETQHAEPAN